MDDQKKKHPDLKRASKRNHPKYYRPITRLTMMWKILTAQIRDDTLNSIKSPEVFPEE